MLEQTCLSDHYLLESVSGREAKAGETPTEQREEWEFV